MFVPDDAALVRNGYDDVCILVQDNTLTTKAALQSRVNRTINKILLLIRDFF